jgi:hypothetical protein
MADFCVLINMTSIRQISGPSAAWVARKSPANLEEPARSSEMNAISSSAVL